MSRREIKTKFDEIVDFAEVEKFLDTPVKRYSSGMYVRLAFAVAAHLEPEILVVDEVLAVGDAAFQKKCLGKMNEVSKEGRTIIFVSHNMSAIQELCSKAIYLESGKIKANGECSKIIQTYLEEQSSISNISSIANFIRSGNLGELARLIKCDVFNSDQENSFKLLFGEPFSVQLVIDAFRNLDNLTVLIRIDSINNSSIVTTSSENSGGFYSVKANKKIKVTARFNNLLLAPGFYWLTISIRDGKQGLDQLQQAKKMQILEACYKDTQPFLNTWGYVQHIPEWQQNKSDE